MRQLSAFRADKPWFRLSLFLALTIVAGAFPAGAVADDCDTTVGCSAKSAKAFHESVGINTHLGYSETVYYKRWADLIKPRLQELGVSHIRDGTFPAGYPDVIGPTVAARYKELGLGLNLNVGHEQGADGGMPATTLQQRLDWIKSSGFAPQVLSVEGSNEYDTDGDPTQVLPGLPERIQSLRDMQIDIWNRVKNDPALASKLVIGPSSGNGYSDDIWYDEVGDLSAYLDRGNLHPYPGEDPPNIRLNRDLGTALDWGRVTYGNKPYWATESGYWNKSPDASNVSESAAGAYVPRMALEYFRRGIERTQFYELIDLGNTNQMIDNYGLLRTDGSRKPAYTALANLMSTLKDTGSAPDGALGFAAVCKNNCHSPIRHVVMRQSDGKYVLALWSESTVWDEVNNTDTPQPNQDVDLNLSETADKVELITPNTGTAAVETYTNTKLVPTQVTDHVRLYRITPGDEPPPPPPESMDFEAEGMKITPWFDVYPEPGVVQDDTTASGGKRLLMRHYGAASQSINTSGDANRLTIRARGDQCAGAPKMTVKVNGTSVGTRDVTATSWTDYTFTVSAPKGTHNVEIFYDNDYEHSACNRNLYLDKVTFSFVARPTRVEAEGMAVSQAHSWSDPNPGRIQKDSTASAGKRLLLWTYGTASKSFTTNHSYRRLVLRAKGDQCNGAPESWISVDGNVVAKHVVSATGWTTYTANVPLAPGSHKVSVQYPNDYLSSACNRNLYIDYLQLAP